MSEKSQRTRLFTVRIPVSLLAEARIAAEADSRSLGSWVVGAMGMRLEECRTEDASAAEDCLDSVAQYAAWEVEVEPEAASADAIDLDRIGGQFIALLESLREAGVFSSAAFLNGSAPPAPKSQPEPTRECPYCDNRRAEGAKAVRRHRAKRKE